MLASLVVRFAKALSGFFHLGAVNRWPATLERFDRFLVIGG